MTVWPLLMTELRLSSTVEPEAVTLSMEAVESSVLTVKADAAAVVDERVSLNVRMTLLPSVDVAAVSSVGGVASGGLSMLRFTIEIVAVSVPLYPPPCKAIALMV